MTKAEAVGMSGVRDKIPDWVGGGVVGTVAYNIAIAICGKVSGSWVAVIPFAVDNPWPFVIWSLMTAGIGFLAALLWRNATHKREMVNKDGRIRELELELEKRDTDVEAAAAAERVRIEEGKKARRIAEEEAERKRDEDMRETISRIDIDALAVLYMIERNGSIEWKERDVFNRDEMNECLDELELYDLIEYVTCLAGRRWSLTKRAKQVIEKYPGLLDEGRKRAEILSGEK